MLRQTGRIVVLKKIAYRNENDMIIKNNNNDITTRYTLVGRPNYQVYIPLYYVFVRVIKIHELLFYFVKKKTVTKNPYHLLRYISIINMTFEIVYLLSHENH